MHRTVVTPPILRMKRCPGALLLGRLTSTLLFARAPCAALERNASVFFWKAFSPCGTVYTNVMPSLYDLPLTTLAGAPTTLAPYRGQVLLIVNVASRCGFTPQYSGLEALYNEFKDRGLVVLGFPANDFGEQEPGTNAEIAAFCSREYPVTFPLFTKVVVTGEAKHPLYRILTSAQPDTKVNNGEELRNHLAEFASANRLALPNEPPELLWNFEKFLVSREGEVLLRVASDVEPRDPRLLSAIEQAITDDIPA